MNAFGNYLLQMGCWLAGFWLIYALVLRNETFFNLNRWFLLSGLVLSLLMPLFPLRYAVEVAPSNVELMALSEAALTDDPILKSSFPVWKAIYGAGMLFFLIRFLWQYGKLVGARKRGEKMIMGTTQLYRLKSDTAPFSFFSKIYVSNKMSNNTELNAVIAHEKVHIDERHWIDLMVLELVRTVQWFNPLLIMYQKAVKENHEYLADRGTLQSGVSAHTYKALLANRMLGVPVLLIANGFTMFNPTKRIFMMNKNKTMPVKRLKLLWAIPVFAIILTAFAKPEYVPAQTIMKDKAINTNTITVKGKVSNDKGEPLHGASVVVAGSNLGTVSGIDGKFILAGVEPDDKIVFSFVGYQTVQLPAQKSLEVQMIRTRTNIEVSGYGNMPGDATPPPPPPPPFLNLRSEDGKNPLILIDRKPFEGDLKTIDINTIEKIEVLKEQSATAMYGKKGENGVVLITTKKQASPSNDEVFVVVEEIPQFKGGPMALKSYLEKATAGSDEKGTVRLQFTVETDGSISKIKTVDSPSKALGEKAISILSSMPAWNPGKQRGKPVAVDYSILIEFK